MSRVRKVPNTQYSCISIGSMTLSMCLFGRKGKVVLLNAQEGLEMAPVAMRGKMGGGDRAVLTARVPDTKFYRILCLYVAAGRIRVCYV